MKILLATPLYPPEIGGPATHAEIVVREFPKHGIKVRLLPFSRVRFLPKIIRHFAYFILCVWHAIGVDIVYALDPVSVGFPASLAARLLRKKLYLRVPGDYAWEQGQQRYRIILPLDEFVVAKNLPQGVQRLQKIQTSVATKADGVIVPSKYLGGIVEKWGINPAKIKVVYSSIHFPEALPDKKAVREKLGINGPYIVSAGRLVPWKGFSALIETISQLKESFPNSMLGIAGDGPDATILRQGALDRNVQDNVQFLGRVPSAELLEHIVAADIFILNTNYEGLSHQLIEVMHAGTPIITTNVGGNTELIENGTEGTLVAYNDTKALQSVVQSILADPRTAEQMAKAAKVHAASFTEANMIQALVPLFQYSK